MASKTAFDRSSKSIEPSSSQTAAARPCLFLSHAGIDSTAAVALAERIERYPEARRHGLTVWVDKRALMPGTPWQDQLEAAIHEQSTAFAIYLTKAGAENWVRMEVRAALDRVIAAGREAKSYPFIPIIAETGLDVEMLPPFARQFQGIHLADADAVQKLIGAMLERPSPTVALVDEPFRGLEAFGAKDAHLFFGREQQIDELVERLGQTNLVMVVGDSGSGKSSLVKAGLVPAFKEGRFAPPLGPRPDPALWHVVEMRPLGHPVESLIKGISDAARSLDVNAGLLNEALRRLRAQDATALRDALREGAPRDAQILLVVDQFEELWTLSPDRARNAFLDSLLDLARPDEPSRRVVMTMRRDYYNLCSSHEGFFRRIEDQDRRGYYNHRRMDDAALRACIERPLALAGVPAADGARLAEEVLRDAGDQPGDLALLEMALTESWQKRSKHGGDLLASYAAIGRVEGAIRKAADEVYRGLGERRELAEPLFMRLVQLGDTGGTTRRVVHADEFAPEVWELAQHLGGKDGKRLLVLGRDQTSETAELAHEQLVTQWPQYQRWLQGTEKDPRAADKRTLDQLMARTARWRERGRKWDDLATGSDLAEFRALAAQRAPWLAPLEATFVGRSSRRRRLNWGAMVAMLVAVLAAGTWAFLDQRQRARQAERQRIEAVATSIGFQLELRDGKVESRDVSALSALAAASRDERLAFVDELFKRASLAERFARNPAVMTRALVGVDPSTRQEVITHAFGPKSATPQSWDSRYAQALLGIELEAPEAIAAALAAMEGTTDTRALEGLSEGLVALVAKLIPERAEQAITPVLATMERTTDPDALEALGEALAAFAPKLTPEQAEQAIARMLAAMERTTDPITLRDIGEGLAALAPKLTPEEAEQAIAAVLAAMERTTDPSALGALGQVLAALPPKLTSEQVEQAIAPVLATMAGTTDTFDREALSDGLAALAPKLTPEEAEQAIARVLAVMRQTTDPHAVWYLSEGLVAFAAKLAPEQAEQAIAAVLAPMGRTTNPDDLWVLAQVLAALAPKLAPEQAEQAVATVLAAMERTTALVGTLGQGLAALPVELTAEQARQAIERVLAVMRQTTDPNGLKALGEGLVALATKLTTGQLRQAIDPVLATMERTPGSFALRHIGQVLAALAPKLTPEQAEQAVATVLAVMGRTTDPHTLGDLSQVLAALAPKLAPEQAEQAVATMLAAMERTTDPSAPAEGLAALLPKLTHEQAEEVVATVLAAMGQTTIRFDLEALGERLVALTAKLTTGQSRRAIAPVLAAMGQTTDSYALRSIGQGLAALPVELTPEQAEQAIAPVLAAMARATDPSALRYIGEGLAALAPKLTPEQAKQAIAPVLAAMARTTGPSALWGLGEGLAALQVELTPEQAEQALSTVLDAIEATNDLDGLLALGGGLAALPVELTPEQAEQAIAPVLAAIGQTSDPYALDSLGQWVVALATKVTPEQAEQAVATVLDAIKGTIDLNAQKALGEGLITLAAKLTPEHAVQALVDAMKIPWIAMSSSWSGWAPSEPLLTALQARLAGEGAPQVGLWETIAEIEQRFGSSIDLTSPPPGVLAQAD